MKLTIDGYSTALYATWYFVHELGILFDAGDGVTAALAQKSGKIRYIFVSHADRDHLTGLIQLIQLNGKGDSPIIYYPADCGSFPALAEFQRHFDPETKQCPWRPVQAGEEIGLRGDIAVRAIPNAHVPPEDGITKSLSYLVVQKKRKLLPQFEGVPGAEIGRLRKEKGEDHITEEVQKKILGYSGDTPVGDFSHWSGCELLIHESTFLQAGDTDGRYEDKHSTLSEVIDAATSIDLGALVLGHFSTRYSHEEIDEAIRSACEKSRFPVPLFRILPQQIERDLLSRAPDWTPTE